MDEDFEDREWADDAAEGAESDAEETGTQEDPEQVIQECMLLFASPDYIMEPGITNTLQRYFSVSPRRRTVRAGMCSNGTVQRWKSFSQGDNGVLSMSCSLLCSFSRLFRMFSRLAI